MLDNTIVFSISLRRQKIQNIGAKYLGYEQNIIGLYIWTYILNKYLCVYAVKKLPANLFIANGELHLWYNL